MSEFKPKILFGLSGSIACYKACFCISKLVQEGCEVQTILSKSAKEFIGPATLEGLTGRPVMDSVYEAGRMMDHIHLARWADLFVIAPASASTISGLANGSGDSPITATFLSYELGIKPIFIAPAMNQQMYKGPALQENLKKLKNWGVGVIEPGDGRQACGEIGVGRMAEPDTLFDVIWNVLKTKREKR